jgi:23S rRNA G2445 N2-methylase RlmL
MEQLKITFIPGLQEVVINEISKCEPLRGKIFLIERNSDSLFFNFGIKVDSKMYAGLLSLKSVMNVFLVQRGEKLHPLHINNHKSILGDMIETVLRLEKEKHAPSKKPAFKTFKLRCAGSDSPEVHAIQKYISETFKLQATQSASTGISNAEPSSISLGIDLDMYIHKPEAIWEIGVRLTPRPLSVRDYKIEHIKGGINPTVAYAMNTMAFSQLLLQQPSSTSMKPLKPDIQTNFSYLNICSGSATLLIEAYFQSATANISTNGHFLGFDIDKKTNSQAIRNIQNAGLIRDIQIKTADLLDKPDFGDKYAKFDIITSDLPFGMQIGKDEDLDKLYKTFVEYTTEKLEKDGVLVVYTTEIDTFEKALHGSALTIDKTASLRLITSVGSIIQPKIFVCSKK